MTLDQELATFESIKPDLLKVHEGKFALIKGAELVGVYENSEDGYTEGIARFGKDIFLLKKIAESDAVFRNHALFSGLMNART